MPLCVWPYTSVQSDFYIVIHYIGGVHTVYYSPYWLMEYFREAANIKLTMGI
jgi:mannitol-specific phosphotransferase system IIBC component